MKSQHGQRGRRFLWAPTVVVAVLCASGLVTGRAAAGSGQTADQVADQIIAVQSDADAAADKLAALDAEASDLADQVAATQAEVDAASAKSSQMEADLAAIALNKYTGAVGGGGTVLPIGSGSIMDEIQTDELTHFAMGAGEVDLGELGAVERDLDRKQAQLTSLQQRNDSKRSQLADTQQALDAKISQLTTLEAQLRDAEVKAAYEAKMAAKRKAEADAAAAADAKAAAALEASAAKVTAAPARGEAAAATTTPAAAPPATTAPATNGDRPTPTPSPTTKPSNSPATTDPPAADPEPPPTAPPVVGSDLACPVAGARAFGDTWGAARSGGRSHIGTDMISPAGTPLVAIDDGFARMKQTSLGGNSVGLTAADGTYYFYAHLSAFEGGSRNVSKGEVIGYVGRTGNTSVNHLHIQIQPAGGDAINPYPIIRRIC